MTMPIESVNPTNGATIRTYKEPSPEEVAAILGQVDEAFGSWRRTSFGERAQLMRAAAQVLRAKTDEYARLMAEEMGKPIREGRAEVEKCAWVCEYYAESAEGFLSREPIETDARQSFVTFEPLGVVLAVMPWNFPFWQVFRFAAPGLMAGNTGVLKHASNVPGCALAIEAVFREAGFPENVFRTLLIGSKQVDRVIEHPKVRAVTLTGSTPAGRAVASKSGSLLKKTVLELGGSDPSVVLADAGVTIDDVALVIPHQSNKRIIESARDKLGIPREKMYINIERFGNTSAASVPLCLDEARRNGVLKPSDLVLFASIGAGFTWASALVRLVVSAGVPFRVLRKRPLRS